MNLLKSISLLTCLFILSNASFAQVPDEKVRVTIKAVTIYSTLNASNENEDYRFKIWFNGEQTNSSCLQVENENVNTPIPVNYTVVSNSPVDITELITLEAEAWEEDGCSDCLFTSDGGCGDDLHMSKNSGFISAAPGGSGISGSSFKLVDLAPGNVTSNLIWFFYRGGDYRVQYLITYTIPRPNAPAIIVEGASYTGSKLCNENNITLSTATAIKPQFQPSLTYVWEYLINNETRTVLVPNPAYCGDTYDCGGGGGPIDPPMGPSVESVKIQLLEVIEPGDPPPCCFEPPFLEQEQEVWRSLGSTTANGEITFDLRSLHSLSTLTLNAVVNFRVRVMANGLSGGFSGVSNTLNVSPLPPRIQNISNDASCPNKNSGIIHVAGVSGVGEYQYNLRPDHYNNLACNPEAVGSCFSGILTGATSGFAFDIPNVPHGEYTLWISNSGFNKGSCSITIDTVTILKIPELSIQLTDLKNVTCNAGSNAEISLAKAGGIAPFVFSLKTGIDSTGNTTGLFSGLTVGTYVASVTDGCLQDSDLSQQTLTINQPVKLSESLFSSENATCFSPGNGKLLTEVLKSNDAYDTIVSNTFRYRLFKDNVLYDSLDSSDPTWAWENLPVSSNYQLIVTESGSRNCNGYTKTFSVDAPPPLNITNLNISNVDCYDGSNGSVTFDGTGGSGSFAFKLSKTAGDTIPNTVGDFSGLYAGEYVLVIENDLPNCLDKVNYPDILKVSQPDSIAIILTKNDITCLGYNDGGISSSLSGGTPGYTYSWEKQDGPFWNIIDTGTTALSGQSAGTYRLSTTDSKSCLATSESVSIIEPDLVGINSIVINDIKCLADKGTLSVIPIGGTLPYSYAYSLDNGSTFTPFTSATPLDEGSYIVKTIDNNGCAFTDPGIYPITSPPTALDFTFSQSDFNGFNISCYGGSNGSITLTSTGGNGASYSGYQYSIDGGAYQVPNLIADINAGTHSITTVDGRGCIVSKDILFTQTNELLTVQVANRQDVVCYGDLTGSIEVQGIGGLSPYLFNIDLSPNQSSTQFSNLGVGTYVIGITDLNGCSATHTESILTLNPRIQFQSAITDVSCFGGSDGLIALNVTDGVQPFQFSWAGQSIITNELNNVGTGSYTVTVTDNAGCKRDSIFTIAQPNQALRSSIATIPVCYGSTTGVITITTSGGTLPYQYSIDNGISYQSNNVFNTVGVGTYSIKIKDDNGCSFAENTQIIQRNDRPEPNFLAATRQNALDTLIIKEISVPKPDSIYWTFDPSAIVISNDAWSPELLFNDAGTYFISMTGFFAGCEYSVTKNLQLNPYDPNAAPSNEPTFRAIESADVSPNPNMGEFMVSVKLTKKYNISLIVYDMIGVTHYGNSYQQVQELSQHITLPQAAAGIYLVRVITDTEARDFRVIVNK